MANRQTFVVGALGVLVGVAVGASSAQNAQTVAFNGSDATYYKTQENWRDPANRDTEILRYRSNGNQVINTPYKQKDGSERRLSDRLRSAAPTVRGVVTDDRWTHRECRKYSGARRNRCERFYNEGDPWQPSFFGL